MSMHLVVCSHKPCWPSSSSPSGYATDGGFPFQMRALSELFESMSLLVPCAAPGDRPGEIALTGSNLAVAPLAEPSGRGWGRKLAMLPWMARHVPVLWREIRRADAVHVPIPGDVGTIGMLMAWAMRKPLFVRHCGNWLEARTSAERFWKWFMQRVAGGRNVMLATGSHAAPPSPENPALRWIFSTSLTAEELNTYAVERDRPDNRCRLVIACRLDKEKGVGVVIDSLPLLVERHPSVTLDVVGNGRELAALQQQVHRLQLSSRVTFHGKVDHATVMRQLHDADLFCYPTSASEGFPKVVLEAIACGLPIVATRVSAISDLLDSGCGVAVDAPTPAAVAGAIDSCFESATRYRAMSAAAVRTARQYSLERWKAAIAASLTAAWGELGPVG
jgi:glycosyltransferase involved in cell wall biosynthesis